MNAAYAVTKINPSLPCQMEGYQARESTHQLDDLELCTVLIECGKPILLHVLDIVLLEQSLSDRIRQAAAQACGISAAQILLLATHTHSGPKVSHFLDPQIAPDADYLVQLEAAVVKNSLHCMAHRVCVTAQWGVCNLEGIFSNRNDADIPCRQVGNILTLTAENNMPVAHILQCACHPTVLGGENKSISSDYMGTLRRTYSNLTNAPCLVINGACGDVSTRLTRRGQDWAEVQRVGTAMATAFAAAQFNADALNFTAVEQSVVQKTYDFTPSDKDLLKQPKQLARHTHVAHILRWGGLHLVAVSGEMVSALGERLYQASDAPLLLGCYANDFHGYAVDQEQYGLYFESFCTQYPPGAADNFVAEIAAALSAVEKG